MSGLGHKLVSLSLVSTLLTAATWFSTGVLADPAPQSYRIDFNSSYRIDSLSNFFRDPKKEFYYPLNTPPGTITGLSSLPLHIEIGSKADAWLDTKIPPHNANQEARSLALQLTSNINEHVRDKIFLNAVPYDSILHMNADAPNNTRFFSFDFMLDTSYEIPRTWVIHLQVWQCCGGHPPFTMQIRKGTDKSGPAELTFGVRDDTDERKPDHPERILTVIAINRGDWHHVELLFSPQSEASQRDGSVVLWYDGLKRFDYKGRWGYDPNQPENLGHRFNADMAIEMGIYRQREMSTQIIYIDNIVYRLP